MTNPQGHPQDVTLSPNQEKNIKFLFDFIQRSNEPADESINAVRMMIGQFLGVDVYLINEAVALFIANKIKGQNSLDSIKEYLKLYQKELMAVQLPSSLPSRQAAFDAIHNARKLSGEEEYSDLEIEATRAFITECTGLPAKFIRLPLVWAVFDKVTAEDQSLDQVSTFLENVEKKQNLFYQSLP